MNPPSVLVTDTNIWIDLQNGDVLADFFRLPYQFITPDFAVGELITPDWNRLQALGLNTFPLESKGISELIKLSQSHRNLSVVDLAALLLAKELRAWLLTGDQNLNRLARDHNITVHGILWVH